MPPPSTDNDFCFCCSSESRSRKNNMTMYSLNKRVSERERGTHKNYILEHRTFTLAFACGRFSRKLFILSTIITDRVSLSPLPHYCLCPQSKVITQSIIIHLRVYVDIISEFHVLLHDILTSTQSASQPSLCSALTPCRSFATAATILLSPHSRTPQQRNIL